jgi:hypothetical protein
MLVHLVDDHVGGLSGTKCLGGVYLGRLLRDWCVELPRSDDTFMSKPELALTVRSISTSSCPMVKWNRRVVSIKPS